MQATVSEIHDYPVRPEGYEEPLFGGPERDREIMEHFLKASWLERASEHATGPSAVASGSGRALAEPREVLVYREHGLPVMEVVEPRRKPRRKVRRCSVRSGAIRRTIDSWREVCGWWEDGGRDLDVFRVELSSGAIVDLARERYNPDGKSLRWLLVGIPD